MAPTLPHGESVEMEVKPVGIKVEKARKRRLEAEDVEDAEEGDTFAYDERPTLRRGRKEGRRVSGVYREIKSLHNIGQNGEVMKLVFDRMPTKEVVAAGCISSMWLTVGYHLLRERLQSAPFVRLWLSEHSNQYVWMNWELHFHEELLSGGNENGEEMELGEIVEKQPKPTKPSIQAIISVGNKAAYTQFTDEDAKLPYRQDHIYAICQDAITTCSNLCCVGSINKRFGYGGCMVVNSLFIPKSEHFTVKGFGLEVFKNEWTTDDVRGKVQVYEEELGENQTLKAMLLIRYTETEELKGFVQEFTNLHGSVEFLVGDAEEVGCNRVGATDHPSAVGFAFYAGRGATVSVYTIDFLKPDSGAILAKMKTQVDSADHAFAIMFTHDSRDWIEHEDADQNESMNWSYATRPESSIDNYISQVHKWLPRTPLLGVKSLFPVEANYASENSNVDEGSKKALTFGFVLVSYSKA